MATSTEMLAAFRELTTTKQLDCAELLDLLHDGIQAALVAQLDTANLPDGVVRGDGLVQLFYCGPVRENPSCACVCAVS